MPVNEQTYTKEGFGFHAGFAPLPSREPDEASLIEDLTVEIRELRADIRRQALMADFRELTQAFNAGGAKR